MLLNGVSHFGLRHIMCWHALLCAAMSYHMLAYTAAG